jgi:hypothetical protein
MFGKKKKQSPKNAPREENFQPEIKHKAEKPNKTAKKKERKVRFSFLSTLSSIIDGSFLTRNWVLRMLPFIMFLVFLAILYIGNQYAALRRVKEAEVIAKELKELRNEHISTKSELMYQKRISEIAKKLEAEGIKESYTPPVKIYVKPEEN